MAVSGKKSFAVGAGAALGMLAILLAVRFVTQNPISIRGAVVTRDEDPAKELPVSDVKVTVVGGPPAFAVRSDASGFFNIHLSRRIRRGSPVTLRFRQPDYEPLDLHDIAGDRLYIAHLTPLRRARVELERGPEVQISNLIVRYSMSTTTAINVGSAVKTFRVVNTGNVPCQGRRPCSPDGKWRAAIGSTLIDAGPGHEFHNARASCVAGPCPFTRIEDTRFSNGSRTLLVSALDWSDTATFLVEAEVYKPVVNDVGRQSYPVVFDQALTFTLPATAEGVSIEAELNGNRIVFPLGPALYLSWAACQFFVDKDRTKVYRCELKPGYRF